MFRRVSLAVLALISFAAPLAAQTTPSSSFAVESDVLSYGLSGYSGIFSFTMRNNLQMAIGVGRYALPSFLLEGDENYDAAEWKATATSVQVARATYRFRGAMKSGPAVGAVILNQRMKLRSEKLGGESTYTPLSVGLTAGYYLHIGTHFYLYPTTAFTYNRVVSGTAAVNGVAYHVGRWAPNASLHAGWEWGR